MHQNYMQTSNTILEISFYSIYNGESFCMCFVCIRCDGCDRVEPLLDGVTVQCLWFCTAGLSLNIPCSAETMKTKDTNMWSDYCIL